MIIRKATPNDYGKADLLMQQLHKLHVCARPDLYIAMEHPYSLEYFKKLVNNSEVLAYVAEENDRLIGLCIATLRNRSNMVAMRTVYLEDIVVDASYRRRGIAKKLFCTVEKEAQMRGAKRLDLMVWDFNKEALAFYEALGMKPQRYILEKTL